MSVINRTNTSYFSTPNIMILKPLSVIKHLATTTLVVMVLSVITITSAKAQQTDYTTWSDKQLLIEAARHIEQGATATAIMSELRNRMGEEGSIVALSETFEKGEGVTEQPNRAFSLLQSLVKKSAVMKPAQKQGNNKQQKLPFYREATFEYACMLIDGYGCQPDIATGVQLLIMCAEEGHKPALRELSLVSKEQGLVVGDDYLQFLMRESNHYDNLKRLSNGYVQVERNGRHGIIDRQGTVIVKVIYDKPIIYHTSGLTTVERNGRYGFVSPYGTEIIAPRYLSASEFNEGVAIVYDNDGWAILDEEGNETLIDNFDAVSSFSDGLAIVKKGNLQGAIDHTGRVVIPPHYEELQPFSCGLAAVRKGKKWGYVDHNGKVVIEFKYDSAQPFVNPSSPFALVTVKGKELCINKKGKKAKIK